MKSTGEVMGIGLTFGEAFAKAQAGAGADLPTKGKVFISVKERDRASAIELGRDLTEQGFELVATRGTGRLLEDAGVACQMINKVYEGRPHIVDMIKSDKIDLIINTTEGRQAISDSSAIRSSAEQHRVYYTTTMAGGNAVCEALKFNGEPTVRCIQTLHQEIV